jgi:hypothetical protein
MRKIIACIIDDDPIFYLAQKNHAIIKLLRKYNGILKKLHDSLKAIILAKEPQPDIIYYLI